MSESVVCLNARAALDEIAALKQLFERAYDTAKISGDENDVLRAKEERAILEKKIRALKEDIWRVESEDVFALSKQYDSQTAFLKKMGVLQRGVVKNDSGGEREFCYINGVDKKEYLIPSLENVRSAMMENKELLMMKGKQGFTKLLVVPFAMDLTVLIDRFESYLKARNQDKQNHFDLNREDPIEIDLSNSMDAFLDELVYHPKNMEAGGRGGDTKEQILETQNSRGDWHRGFEFIFVQKEDDSECIRSIPHQGKGTPTGKNHGRADVEAGKDANEYVLEMVASQTDPDSPYFRESGMTLEAWIIAFMTQLEETGTTLDTLDAIGSAARLAGAYSPRNDMFICAYWDGDEAKAKIVSESSNNKDSVSGTRMVVRI